MSVQLISCPIFLAIDYQIIDFPPLIKRQIEKRSSIGQKFLSNYLSFFKALKLVLIASVNAVRQALTSCHFQMHMFFVEGIIYGIPYLIYLGTILWWLIVIVIQLSLLFIVKIIVNKLLLKNGHYNLVLLLRFCLNIFTIGFYLHIYF